jgi:hypothetical protein
MTSILTSQFFTYFIVTLLTTGFSIFVKSVSRADKQKALTKEDFAVGLELSVTALILFITDSVTYTKNLLLHQGGFQAEPKIIAMPWIIFAFFIGIWSISTLIRRKGWTTSGQDELNWISGIIIPNVFGLLSLIFVVNWITS